MYRNQITLHRDSYPLMAGVSNNHSCSFPLCKVSIIPLAGWHSNSVCNERRWTWYKK
jgi:hypothetical protein